MPGSLGRWQWHTQPTHEQLLDLVAWCGAWIFIGFLTSVAPLCACQLLWTFWSPPPSDQSLLRLTIHYLITTFSALEVLFTIYYYCLAYRVGKHVQESSHSHAFIRDAFKQCMEAAEAESEDFREFFRYWFHGARFEDISRGDVLEWLAWSLFNEHNSKTLSNDKGALMDECLELLEERTGWKFPERRNTHLKVRSIRLTLDPIKVLHRPLFIYALIMAFQRRAINHALSRGFVSRHTSSGTRYLIHVPSNWTPKQTISESETPLVFLHGLGCGLASYASLIAQMATDPALSKRPILAILQPHVSMAIFDRAFLKPPSQESAVADVREIFDMYGFDKSGVTTVSHSNGSTFHSWILKAMPHLIRRSGFVDPVCFCVWEPFVCYNFLHRPPRTPIEVILRYFVSRELGIALVLQRAFSWSGAVLFPSQIPNFNSPYHTTIILAEKDEIINGPRMHRYLSRNKVGQVKLQYGQRHGGDLTQRGILEWIAQEETF